MEEAFKHFKNKHGLMVAAGIPGWFRKTDKDGNGMIDPAEFDDDLTREKIPIYPL